MAHERPQREGSSAAATCSSLATQVAAKRMSDIQKLKGAIHKNCSGWAPSGVLFFSCLQFERHMISCHARFKKSRHGRGGHGGGCPN